MNDEERGLLARARAQAGPTAADLAHRAREAQAISLQASIAKAERDERSHAGLFIVSPLAWAIKKTWNGKPKRR